jgi:transposase
MHTLFVGIDVSKRFHDVAIVNGAQQLLAPIFRIAESRAGYEELRIRLARVAQRESPEQTHFGMEATGDYWKNLFHFLKEQSPAWIVSVLHPVQTKRFAQAELRRAKTDPVNALDLARMLVEKRPRPHAARAAGFEAIKDVNRQIVTFTKQHTMTLNKLRLELDKVAPELEHHMSTPVSQQMLALLANYPTAAAIAHASTEELRALRYGSALSGWHLPLPFIARMKALCENSIAHKVGSGAGVVVQALVKRLAQEQQAIAELKAQLPALYAAVKDRLNPLATIKGITPETAITLEAHIGDVHRFATAKQIVAYFGMNPTIYLSGASIRGASHLEKKGSGVVRRQLFLIVLNFLRLKVEPFYSYYQRLVNRGKPKLVAIAATMRKLLVIIYTLLKTQQPFDPNKKF